MVESAQQHVITVGHLDIDIKQYYTISLYLCNTESALWLGKKKKIFTFPQFLLLEFYSMLIFHTFLHVLFP